MVKGKKAMSKEDSSESVEYPSGELKVRKKGSKLNNGAGKKAAEEPQSAASKKAAAKKRARKPPSQSRNMWVVGFLSFLAALIGTALCVYNWSLHDDFDLSRFWADNEQRVLAIVQQVADMFMQQQAISNGTESLPIEAPPPPEPSTSA